MKLGRPCSFTQELADEICETVANNGIGISRLCKLNPHWPTKETIFQWRRKFRSFSDQYTRAKIDQISAMVEDILDISDDGSHDTKINNNGEESLNGEWVARSRLRVDSRKWFASKLAPKIYGDNPGFKELAEELKEFREMREKTKDEKHVRKEVDCESDKK